MIVGEAVLKVNCFPFDTGDIIFTFHFMLGLWRLGATGVAAV